MKRNIIFTALSLLLAVMISSCMGTSSQGVLQGGDGISEGLPTGGARLTDVGNSEEGEELMKRYVNPEFEVKALYPGSWDLEERGTERADFRSAEGESVTATFVWLGEGDAFEDFLIDARGDISDLNEIAQTEFDRTFCADAETTEDGMLIVECYHYYEFEKGNFVASVGGLMLPESVGLEAEPYGMKVINEINDASRAMTRELIERGIPKPCVGVESPQAIEPVRIEVKYFRPVIKVVKPLFVD